MKNLMKVSMFSMAFLEFPMAPRLMSASARFRALEPHSKNKLFSGP